jgi:hypothetical protein
LLSYWFWELVEGAEKVGVVYVVSVCEEAYAGEDAVCC